MPGERRQRDGGGAGMAEVPGWRGRDHGGAGMMEAGWRGQDHGGTGITEPSPGSTPGTEMLQPAPTPRGARSGRTPDAEPAWPLPRCGLVPPPRLRPRLRAVPEPSPRLPARPLVAVAPWGPCPTAWHGSARIPLPRGRPGSAVCCTGLGCAGAAGAAVPVPGVPLPQEPGAAVPGVPEAREGRRWRCRGSPVPGVSEARRDEVAMPGVPGAPVPRVPDVGGP